MTAAEFNKLTTTPFRLLRPSLIDFYFNLIKQKATFCSGLWLVAGGRSSTHLGSSPGAISSLTFYEIRAACRDYARQQVRTRIPCYFPSALRFSLAQALSFGTAFSGGPPCVPQAHGPSIFASVTQGQDFVFRQAQT